MAQGNFKSKKLAVPGPKKQPNPLRLSKGSKVIATKNKKLQAQQRTVKKISAGLTAKTERMLAEKAGHLELLAGGKRSSKNSGKAGAAKSKGPKGAKAILK